MRQSATAHNRIDAGFTALFAMLVAALLLAVGLSIFEIIFKEVSFATITRDSNYAMYAADNGGECALYWDYDHKKFSSSNTGAVPSGVVCNGQDVFQDGQDQQIVKNFLGSYTPVIGPPNGTEATTTFAVRVDAGNSVPYCAIVQIGKVTNGQNQVFTNIITRGYNTCDFKNPNRIEQAYQITYSQ